MQVYVLFVKATGVEFRHIGKQDSQIQQISKHDSNEQRSYKVVVFIITVIIICITTIIMR